MVKSILMVALICGVSASSAVGQADTRPGPYAQQLGLHDSVNRDFGANARARTIDVGDDHFRPWPWFIGGALVGGVGLGGLAAYEVSACATNDSCMFAGQYVLIAAGVGALGGGLITLFVYSLIRGGS